MAVNIISRQDLIQKIDTHSVEVVEALPEEAFERCHLPGAKNLPADRAKELASSVLPNKNADIVVYCTNPG